MTDEPPGTRGLVLGKLFGARIVMRLSTLVMLGVLAFFFASGDDQVTSTDLVLGLVLALLLFASVFLHETAHAMTARAFGREVKEIVITVWGGHTSFDGARMTPLVSGMTAAAGPAMNLVIAGLAQVVYASGALPGQAGAMVGWLAFANVILAGFNALPGIPMDGGRVLEAVVWGVTGNQHRGTIAAAWGGRVVAIGVVAYGLLWPLTRGERPTLFSVVWVMLIFWLLWPAASVALKYSQLMDKRAGMRLQKVMVPAVGVEHTVSVQGARGAAHAVDAREVVVLSGDGAPAGHFPVALTDEVPAEERGGTGLEAVTMPLPRGAVVDAGLAGEDLVRSLREWWGKTEVWAVLDDGRVVGVVHLSSVLDKLK